MPSYQERAELIKTLANQAYFDAINKPKIDAKAIQEVGTDGQTGRSLLSHPDGGVTSNGVKQFNTATPQDGYVAARIDPNSNAIAINGRQRKDAARVRILDEAITSNVATVSVNGRVISVFDGDSVTGVYTIPLIPNTSLAAWSVLWVAINKVGTKLDDWVVSLVLREVDPITPRIVEQINYTNNYKFLSIETGFTAVKDTVLLDVDGEGYAFKNRVPLTFFRTNRLSNLFYQNGKAIWIDISKALVAPAIAQDIPITDVDQIQIFRDGIYFYSFNLQVLGIADLSYSVNQFYNFNGSGAFVHITQVIVAIAAPFVGARTFVFEDPYDEVIPVYTASFVAGLGSAPSAQGTMPMMGFQDGEGTNVTYYNTSFPARSTSSNFKIESYSFNVSTDASPVAVPVYTGFSNTTIPPAPNPTIEIPYPFPMLGYIDVIDVFDRNTSNSINRPLSNRMWFLDADKEGNIRFNTKDYIDGDLGNPVGLSGQVDLFENKYGGYYDSTDSYYYTNSFLLFTSRFNYIGSGYTGVIAVGTNNTLLGYTYNPSTDVYEITLSVNDILTVFTEADLTTPTDLYPDPSDTRNDKFILDIAIAKLNLIGTTLYIVTAINTTNQIVESVATDLSTATPVFTTFEAPYTNTGSYSDISVIAD